MRNRIGHLPQEHGTLRIERGRVILSSENNTPQRRMDPRDREALQLAVEIDQTARRRRRLAVQLVIVVLGAIVALYVVSLRLKPALIGGWQEWAILALWSAAIAISVGGALRVASIVERTK